MSETGRMLAETTLRLLAAEGGSVARKPEALLASVRDAGLDLALVPEDQGGFGCRLADAAEIARAFGAHAASLPIVEILLAPLAASLTGWPDLGTDATLAQDRPGTTTVSEAPLFPGCGRVLALRRERDGDTLAIAEASGTKFLDLAGQEWIRIESDAAEGRPLARGSCDLLERNAALLTAALISGALDHVVGTMIEHANTRTQFGRPIGKFQAVQHLIADASSEATVTRASLSAALAEADAGTPGEIDWLSAKAQAGRAATSVAAAAHQLLGAIGFTEEHELHRYTKRLWWWRDDWGRQADCEARLGALAASLGGAGLWPAIVGEDNATENAA